VSTIIPEAARNRAWRSWYADWFDSAAGRAPRAAAAGLGL